MDVPLTNVITLIIAIATAAVSIGVTLGKLATVLEKIKGLEKSRDLARERFEKIDQRLIAMDAVKEDRRQRRTHPQLPAVRKGETAAPQYVAPEGSDDDD